MKVNFKRMITALAAAAMCAVPMTSAMSASAEEYMTIEKRQSLLETQMNEKVKQQAFKAEAEELKVDVIEVPASLSKKYKPMVDGLSQAEKVDLTQYLNSTVGLYTQDPPRWWVGKWPPKNPVASTEMIKAKKRVSGLTNAEKVELAEYMNITVGHYTPEPPPGWEGPWPPYNPYAKNGAELAKVRPEVMPEVRVSEVMEMKKH